MPFLTRKLADGLFLDVCKQVSKDFPNIKFNDVLLDRACLHVCFTNWFIQIRSTDN